MCWRKLWRLASIFRLCTWFSLLYCLNVNFFIVIKFLSMSWKVYFSYWQDSFCFFPPFLSKEMTNANLVNKTGQYLRLFPNPCWMVWNFPIQIWSRFKLKVNEILKRGCLKKCVESIFHFLINVINSHTVDYLSFPCISNKIDWNGHFDLVFSKE